MSYPDPRQSQDAREPLLKDWHTMALKSGSITGKEDDIISSTNSSDTTVNRPSFKKTEYGKTFATQGLREDHYRPVDSYEGLHRYDPDFEWAPEEEKRVVRKVRIVASFTI